MNLKIKHLMFYLKKHNILHEYLTPYALKQINLVEHIN